MVDLKALALELHEAAVEKGFWDVDEAAIKHIAKMHSELSEAVQEDRCGRPMLYVDDIEVMDKITDPAMFDGRKPEGVAAELADAVMMTLDYACKIGMDIASDLLLYRERFRQSINESCNRRSLPSLILELHECIVHMSNVNFLEMGRLAACGVIIFGTELWLEQRGIDLWQVIRLKMEYNKSRPKLHGRAY